MKKAEIKVLESGRNTYCPLIEIKECKEQWIAWILFIY